MSHNELWLQITAGKGPDECSWAVVRVMEKVCDEAAAAGLETKTIEIEPGPKDGTALSVLIAITGSDNLKTFANSWAGTVQWIARSPFRPDHKRKNWFVGIEILEPVAESRFNPKEVQWETMRASGPGGQHVNRTESAVRATHLPTGVQATAMEERSQHRNRKLASARLAQKLVKLYAEKLGEARDSRWRAHQQLERGNPTRIFREEGV